MQQPTQHAAAGHAARSHRPHGLHWLMGFGTLGLFIVSTIDSSPIPLPLPGSSDLLLVLLVAHRANPFLAAAAAIAGSLVGGYLSWKAGVKGGEPALHRYMPKRFARHMSQWVETKGSLALVLSALLPPPFPLTPFLLAAGALGISRKRFFVFYGLARAFRYSLVAWLAEVYGRAMVRAFRHYLSGWSTVILWVYLGALGAAVLFGVWKYRHEKSQAPAPSEALTAK